MSPRDLVLPEPLTGDARYSCEGLSFELFRVEKAHQSSRHPGFNIVLKLVALLSNDKLLEGFYEWSSTESRQEEGQNDPVAIKVSTRQQRRVKSAMMIAEADELLDFVVPDDDSIHLPAPKEVQQEPVAPVADERRPDWDEVIQHVAGMNPSVDLEQALDKVLAENLTLRRDQQYNMSLADYLENVQISDIDEASSILHDWHVATLHGDNETELSSEHLRQPGPRALLDEYHGLTASFVGGISSEVPDRARVQTERLVRTVALDMSTSGILVSTLGTVAGADGTESAPSQELPAVEDLRISSPIPPTPSSPEKSSRDQAASEQDAPFSFLRHYTTFTNPSEAQGAPSAATNILAHLPTTLSNPADYSHTAIEADVAATQKSLALESMTERERRKVEREALRQQQREARQQKLREDAERLSSFVPSLAVKDPRDIKSSQEAVDQWPQSSQGIILPMTQPERGAFGERMTKKTARRGKRTKGF
jgi:hypothetical protein